MVWIDFVGDLKSIERSCNDSMLEYAKWWNEEKHMRTKNRHIFRIRKNDLENMLFFFRLFNTFNAYIFLRLHIPWKTSDE